MMSRNTAIIPVSKLEEDCYDWWERHEAVLAVKKQMSPEIVMIGDSITHFWGGEPESAIKYGGDTWAKTFGSRVVLNLGFGWDRTQNVLWRLDHGEFDGLAPRTIVLNIGTNNFSETDNARANTPEEICEGILIICERLHSMSPESRMVVMCVFPRGEFPDSEIRQPIAHLNGLLKQRIPSLPYATLLDITSRFIEQDGSISPEIMFDFTHPTPKGYAIWAKALAEAGIV